MGMVEWPPDLYCTSFVSGRGGDGDDYQLAACFGCMWLHLKFPQFIGGRYLESWARNLCEIEIRVVRWRSRPIS